jgi:hypothetical protein
MTLLVSLVESALVWVIVLALAIVVNWRQKS